MEPLNLAGKTILVTGAAHRVGRALALAVAQAGGDVIVHYGHSQAEAHATQAEIQSLGQGAHLISADLADPDQVQALIPRALQFGPLDGLVNNAAIFAPNRWDDTDLTAWNRHLMINLTAPFLLSQAFARTRLPDQPGRIVNILDWRALRPGPDHLPYTISKAGLVALTKSLAQALAPQVNVNGIALGAILPPSDGTADNSTAGNDNDATAEDPILKNVPAQRWAELEEVQSTLLFLLAGPTYITGEVIHVDGGRHLV